MLPSRFTARTPDDFCGHARQIAGDLQRLSRLAQRSGDPLVVILLGPPGVGKSNLSNFLAAELGASKWNLTRLNGTEINLDAIGEIRHALRFTDMFGGYRIFQFEELDRMTNAAQVAALTLLDDLPPKVAVIGTSNCKLGEFEERFQRRFSCFEVGAPRTEEVGEFLGRHWPEVPEATRKMIAFGTAGNVGMALKDMDTALADTLKLAA